ncbi:GntR family transcriptional regulator [Shinella pollutisoli]|uniref:GntR family transcriptional regulator n=1 Tax=Shinella pollutisoli TaxID=2250594 RepID=A0ABV7DIJ6_9HYPH|nr:GntR family transcriptional regulator [Shinella pollutisoli]
MTETTGSQAHLAYRALEGLIVSLKLEPGALVTEKELIALSGHGRTPVREAIQKLAWQGLMEVRPRAGLRITAIRPGDHAEVMQARRRLEPLAAELVAIHADERQRERLVACAQAMTACSIRSDIEGFLAADKDFDGIMEEACPNRFLTAALAPLQTHARRLWFARADERHMDRSIELHVRVIRAVRQADGPGAAAAMAELMDVLAG